MGFLKMGKVSVDGTHIKASASINKNVTYKRAKELKAKLEADVAELLEKAESSDETSNKNEELPDEIKRREAMITKMDEAMRKLKKRKEKEKETGKKTRGKKPQFPDPDLEKFAEESEKCINLTDSDSKVMRKNKQSGYTQSFNMQASVESESYLIVGHYIGECSNDKRELVNAYNAIPAEVGKPETFIADAGYAHAENIEEVEEVEEKTDLYFSVYREDAHHEREYEYRPSEKIKSAPKQPKHKTLLKMKEKLETEGGKAIYKLRSQTVETVFGTIKEAMGFRGFRVRGEEKVGSEWELLCVSYNLKRLFNMKMA